MTQFNSDTIASMLSDCIDGILKDDKTTKIYYRAKTEKFCSRVYKELKKRGGMKFPQLKLGRRWNISSRRQRRCRGRPLATLSLPSKYILYEVRRCPHSGGRLSNFSLAPLRKRERDPSLCGEELLASSSLPFSLCSEVEPAPTSVTELCESVSTVSLTSSSRTSGSTGSVSETVPSMDWLGMYPDRSTSYLLLAAKSGRKIIKR